MFTISPSSTQVDGLAISPEKNIRVSALTQAKEVAHQPRTVDELVRNRAQTSPHLPLVSYPHDGLNYTDYTAFDLDQFAYHAARKYSAFLPARKSSSTTPIVVALLGTSTLDYLVTMLAITKLGHTALYLSTRISREAYANLLEKTASTILLVDHALRPKASELQQDINNIRVETILSQEEYQGPAVGDTCMTGDMDLLEEQQTVAWIIHSSGSTGLPKPIFQTQKAAINNYAGNMNMKGFITLPLFHAHGIGSTFRAIYSRKQIHLYNASLPLTKQNLRDIMRRHSFEIFYGVPYTLKLLSEDDEGIQLLMRCEVVMFGGSAFPDPLGDKLVNAGVNLVSHWGSSETGQLMTSFRPPNDKYWDYLRPSDIVKRFLLMEPRGEDLYEAVCLDGWPSKVVSNRPDGSYAMKDLFTRHPSLPDAWKYYGRLDDTIVLVNGEKAMPLAIEGAARQHPFVEDAIAFGQQKDCVGMAVIKSRDCPELSDDELKTAILDSVEKVQSTLPAYARISAEMMMMLSSDTDYPKTDKGTIVRLRFYKQFEKEIDRLYEEASADRGTMCLNLEEMRAFLRTSLENIDTELAKISDDQDFFSAGMDSLQAARLRLAISKTIDVGGRPLGMNIAFEQPSIDKLANYLIQARDGITLEDSTTVEEQMETVLRKYAIFASCHTPREEHRVILTGVTGSLGAHIAAILAQDERVSEVFCLIRASADTTPHERLVASLKERRVFEGLSMESLGKLSAIPADLSRPSLGLSSTLYNRLRRATSIIHSAWSVNFNLSLSSFDDCIAGARNLMQLCLDSTACNTPSFNFCSSVSTVSRTEGVIVKEDIPTFAAAQSMGYAQSKNIVEHLCGAAAREGLPTRILRIGQIIGDTKNGVWNHQEAIPMMLQTAKTIGALPALDENIRWLPVDVVAQSCVDISLKQSFRKDVEVFNLLNHKTIHWTRELLPMLRRLGLEFQTIGQLEWIEKLGKSNPDPAVNPPIKLIQFFTGKYGQAPQDTTRLQFEWESHNAAQASHAFRNATAPTEEQMSVILAYFLVNCWAR